MDSSDLDPTQYMVHRANMSQPPKRHLDRFNRFLQGSPLCPTDRQTDTQTTLCAAPVAIGRIYAVHAMLPKNDTIRYDILTCAQKLTKWPA